MSDGITINSANGFTLTIWKLTIIIVWGTVTGTKLAQKKSD